MLKKTLLVVLMLVCVSLYVKAEEILGVESYNGSEIKIKCIENKVYADLSGDLAKIVWEVDNHYEHLDCKDYFKWKKENEH